MTTSGSSVSPTPWWYFVAVGALGPALILQNAGTGLYPVIGIVAGAVILVGLVAHHWGRRALRTRAEPGSAARTWRFTGLIIAVVVVTQLVQRAGDARSPGLVAAASFVILGSTSWWLTRRLESDESEPSATT